MLNRLISTLIGCFLLFTISFAAVAPVKINNVTPSISFGGTAIPPEGYTECHMTKGAWVNNVWASPHQECTYPGPTASSWVAGYWACLKVGPKGICSQWKRVHHHWVRGNQVRVYFRDIPSHRRY